jgi:hypothetical protein
MQRLANAKIQKRKLKDKMCGDAEAGKCENPEKEVKR